MYLLYVAPSVIHCPKETWILSLIHIYLATRSYVYHLSLKSIYFSISPSLIQTTITSHPDSSFQQFLPTPYSPYNPLSTLQPKHFFKNASVIHLKTFQWFHHHVIILLTGSFMFSPLLTSKLYIKHSLKLYSSATLNIFQFLEPATLSPSGFYICQVLSAPSLFF